MTTITGWVTTLPVVWHDTAFLPPWCNFPGVNCNSDHFSSTFGSVSQIHVIDSAVRGTLPSSLPNLLNIIILNLSHNQISGSIPVSVGYMKSILLLALRGNMLTGTIPETFNQLSRLYHLDLANNYLTMGELTSVSRSTFSTVTLSNMMFLETNCLAFIHPGRSVYLTHCRLPISSKSLLPTCITISK